MSGQAVHGTVNKQRGHYFMALRDGQIKKDLFAGLMTSSTKTSEKKMEHRCLVLRSQPRLHMLGKAFHGKVTITASINYIQASMGPEDPILLD